MSHCKVNIQDYPNNDALNNVVTGIPLSPCVTTTPYVMWSDNPQVYGITTVFEGSKTKIY